MIRRPVVFIVGAGASAEFRFPVGNALRDGIAQDVKFQFEFARKQISGSPELLEVVRHAVAKDRVGLYIAAGNRLAPAMPPQPTVDEALEYFAEEEVIIHLGKLAIARRILDRERNAKTLPANDDQELLHKFVPDPGIWLFRVYSMAVRGHKQSAADGLFDHVTMINFNYDRTVEHGLYLALQKQGHFSPERASAALGKMRILRPYGSIGPLPWQDRTTGIPYGSDNVRHVVSAAGDLRTFTEQNRHDDKLEADIRTALTNAALVIFLGFGFHSQNMRLLKIPERRRVAGRIFATTYGMPDVVTQALRGRVCAALNCTSAQWESHPMTAAQLLTDLDLAIMELIG